MEQCDADEGKYTISYFEYHEDIGYVFILIYGIGANVEICAHNNIHVRFKRKRNGCSER